MIYSAFYFPRGGLTAGVTGGWEDQLAKRKKLLAKTRFFRGAHQPSGARFVRRFFI
jgi:hypothetical protein